MEYSEILSWLREDQPGRLAELWQKADQTRQQYVGGEVHLRGLVEISNYCIRLCGDCRAPYSGDFGSDEEWDWRCCPVIAHREAYQGTRQDGCLGPRG